MLYILLGIIIFVNNNKYTFMGYKIADYKVDKNTSHDSHYDYDTITCKIEIKVAEQKDPIVVDYKNEFVKLGISDYSVDDVFTVKK